MAKTAKTRSTPDGRSGFRFGSFLLGFFVAAALAVAGWSYLRPKQRPVIVAHHKPASTAAETSECAVPTAPFAISEDVFEAGATTYAKQCAACHGRPGHDANSPHAHAVQLWTGTDVAALAPGSVFNDIKFGDCCGTSHAFGHTLSDLQIWQVALLLHHANEDLPSPVMKILQSR